ncbi:MAG: signal peptidase I [Pseudomonadales bacterium]
MDIDMPLVLTWAVLITGAIWAFDVLFLKSRRLAARQALVESGGKSTDVAEQVREPVLVEYARSFFPILVLVLVLRSFLAEPYQIPSESMVPTLQVGDFVLVNKFAYGVRLPVLGTKIFDVGEPRRGDIMVFIPPHDPRYFIKRVIGIPGDVIRYENKVLYINGVRTEYEFVSQFEERTPFGSIPIREYTETFDGRSHEIYRYQITEQPREWTVPENSYFMMGDNRGKSEDSRKWGFAKERNIVGKAVAIWVHKEPGFHWPTFSRNRWF